MSQPFDQQQTQYYDKDGLPVDPPVFYAQQSQYAPQPQYAMVQQPVGEPRSWVVALLLAFFLGLFGAHNLYLGYQGRGMAQLILTFLGFLSSIVGIGIIIGFVMWPVLILWVFVEFIMILGGLGTYDRDGRGIPLKK